jgi:O-antigen ligase
MTEVVAKQSVYAFLRAVFLRHWAMLFFLLVAAIATVFSLDRRQSISTQLPLLVGLLLYVFIVDVVNTVRKMRTALVMVSMVTVLMVLLSMHNLLLVVAEKPLEAVRALDSLLLVVPNDVLVLSVVMPVLLGAAWCGMGWLRVLALCGFVISLVLSESLQSRQAVALLLCGQMLVVAMMRPRWAVPAALVLLGLGLLTDALTGWRLLQKILLFPRTYVWHTAWVMFLDRPWSGQGPGLFGDIYFSFLSKAGYVLSEVSDRRPMLWAHNLYLEQLAERGIGGLLALLSVLGASAGYAWQAWRRMQHEDTARALAAGVFSAIVMLIMAGIAEASLSRIWVSVLLMLLAAFAVSMDNISQHINASVLATTASNDQE